MYDGYPTTTTGFHYFFSGSFYYGENGRRYF